MDSGCSLCDKDIDEFANIIVQFREGPSPSGVR